MRIRDAQPADAAAIAALLEELGYPADPLRVERRLRRISNDADSRLFVAELDGEVAGLAGLHLLPLVQRDEVGAEMTAMVVAAAHRRKGVGAGLVRAVEHEARLRGCGRLALSSANRRSDAHAFYERLGFESTGLRFAKTL